MDDLNGGINLQIDAIRQVEELYPKLHGWSQAVDLHEGGQGEPEPAGFPFTLPFTLE